MKYIKYFLILTIVAVGVSMTYTKAYNYPTTLSLPISTDLKPSAIDNTGYRSKINDTFQYYENQYAYTTLSYPCEKCTILTTLYKTGNLTVSKLTTKMYETKKFNDSELIDDYYLTLQRADVTLLSTHHIGIWYISKTP